MGVVHDERDPVPRVERAEERLQVVPVPQQDVREHRAERQVRRDQVQRVRRREVRGLQCVVSLCTHGQRNGERTPSCSYLTGSNLPLVRSAVWLYWLPFWSCTKELAVCSIKVHQTTHEDGLAHEGELLRVPEIAVVDGAHEDVREDDADVLVDLQPDWVVQAPGADQVPVETP